MRWWDGDEKQGEAEGGRDHPSVLGGGRFLVLYVISGFVHSVPVARGHIAQCLEDGQLGPHESPKQPKRSRPLY